MKGKRKRKPHKPRSPVPPPGGPHKDLRKEEKRKGCRKKPDAEELDDGSN